MNFVNLDLPKHSEAGDCLRPDVEVFFPRLGSLDNTAQRTAKMLRWLSARETKYGVAWRVVVSPLIWQLALYEVDWRGK